MAFSDTMIRWLENIMPPTGQINLRQLLTPLFDRQTSLALNTAGLVIKAGGGVLVKSGAADCYLLANGVLQKITAATDMPALVGTVINATFNVFCFFIDSGGTKTSAMGTAGSTLAKVVFPALPLKKALIGFIIVNPTGTGNFVGGTTALDDGTVVPGVVYINGVAFDPACLTGL
jgi:hypothetical protein